MRGAGRPLRRQRGAPLDLDLEALNLPAGLDQAFLQVPAAGRGLEGGHHLAQAGELVGEQLLVAPGGVRAQRGQPPQIGLAVEGVLDGMARGLVFGRDPGTPAFDSRRQERDAPAVVGPKLAERVRELFQKRHLGAPLSRPAARSPGGRG
jgi:hypothetical protein